ncbi:negative modulator of initiation of replication [Paraglaciecola polaris]|uniref:Negative modulator of initiation of replication n=1 Tax=Paraglaciecola polaris LMG 21857 TaxID=1129793 RepID=K6Z737_9ALTE|nr:negative modulator of initiation of replication [Paraglaciecola polaris]GAC32011.1 negative modulator of initiation of replication [Paraglaciecola polaris LMG 21857]|tara:strand:+ start:1864 stop:2385 length:522 start_codon:yes stop_codon:yes gene_type:complete
MKNIEIEDDLYAYIASQTQHIGETASDILRRLVMPQGSVLKQAVSTKQTGRIVPTGNVFSQITTEELREYPKMVERFIKILSVLENLHGAQFDEVLTLSGRNRVYFAKDKDTLLQASSVTNPKQIGESTFWVMTNNNTAKKASLLKEVADVLGYSTDDAQRLAVLFAPELYED